MRQLLAIGLLAAGAVLPVPTPAAAATDRQAVDAAASVVDEEWFVGQINRLRASAGLEPLRVDPELTKEARRWAATMASDGQLAHAPDLPSGISAAWDVLGENVGVIGRHDLDELFGAFVDSPTHYENLIDPRYERVGVGVVRDPGGRVWTTHRFMSAGP